MKIVKKFLFKRTSFFELGFLIISATILPLLFTSCEKDINMMYKKDQIKVISTVVPEGGNGLIIGLQPFMETAFYFAGATVEYRSDQIRVKLIKCRLGSECQIDLQAINNQESPITNYLMIEGVDKKLVLLFEDNEEIEVFSP